MKLNTTCTTSYARLNDLAAEPSFDSHDWLNPAERIELESIRHALRRRQWLAGRLLAKRLIQAAIGCTSLADAELLTRDERGRGVRPQIRVAGRKLARSISISHSEHGVLAALTADAVSSVGVDLTELEPKTSARVGSGFRRLWFTPCEQRWLDVDPMRRTATLWALKEAVYKACNTGEAFTPQQIEIVPLGSDQFRCQYRSLPLSSLSLSVRDLDGHVAAVAHMPLNPTLSQSNRSIPERQDARAIDRLEPVVAQPETAFSPSGSNFPHTFRFPRVNRFDQPSTSQPAGIFRKPS